MHIFLKVYLLELWIFLKETNYAVSECICLWREASFIQSIVNSIMSAPLIITCCILGALAHICESVLSFLIESWVSLKNALCFLRNILWYFYALLAHVKISWKKHMHVHLKSSTCLCVHNFVSSIISVHLLTSCWIFVNHHILETCISFLENRLSFL